MKATEMMALKELVDAWHKEAEESPCAECNAWDTCSRVLDALLFQLLQEHLADQEMYEKARRTGVTGGTGSH